MSKTESKMNDELMNYIEETLGEHQDTLERLATLETDLSPDAERALQILRDRRDQS